MSESTLEPKLKMLVWNVQWGKQEEKLLKLNERSEIGQYDIICLIEAYKPPADHVKLQTALKGFSNLYMENRKSRKKLSRIGGISVFVKKQKANTNTKESVVILNIVKDEQGLVKWLKIDGKSFDFKADVYVCVVYLPGPTSVYWGRDGEKDEIKEKEFFKKISDAVNEHKSNGDMVIVAGDFNCRIGDFQGRDSPDKYPLIRDKLFKKLVTDSNLFILNGRDEASSQYTCHKKGESETVVDYALVSDFHRSGVKLKVGAFGETFELTEFNSDHRSLEIVVTKADTERVYHAALNEERDAKLDKKIPISSIGSSSEEECFIICDNCKYEIPQADLQISDTRSLETVETKTDKDMDVSDAALNEKNPMSSSVPSSEEFIMCDDCKCEVPQADRSTHEVPVLKQPDTDLLDAALKRDSKLDKKIICDNCKREIPQAADLSTHEVDVLKRVNRLLKLFCEECAVRVTGVRVTGVNCRNE